MTTNAFTSNIQQGGQAASATTAKKNAKQLSSKGLSELFSQIPQQTTPAAKPKTVSFKKILEPAKAAAATEQPEKKTKTTDPMLCVAECTAAAKAEITPQPTTAETATAAQPVVRKELPHQTLEQSTSNVRPTIDPRSPMHGQTLGSNDSGKTLVTDGPKAKENAPPQKPAAVIQPSVEVNTAPSKSIPAASDNSLKKGTESTLQPVSVQTTLPPEAAVSAADSKAKTPAAKGAATSAEKVQLSHQASNIESNIENSTDRGIKPAQPRAEIAYHKQNQESTVAAPAKIDTKAAAVTEQVSPPTVANAGAVTANTSTTAANAATNAGATVHEQVASVAAAAFSKVGQKIAVNLNPPELGRISIKFEKNGDEVVGRVEVEKSQTKSQIDLNLSQIVQNLQDSGVQLKRLEVVLQEQPLGNQQEFADHARPDRNGNHQFSSEKNYSDIHSAVSANEQFAYSATGDSYFSDKSVNILV